ncbi:MAG: hypothetical protein EOO88_57025, partial [Pedobacter sp.]
MPYNGKPGDTWIDKVREWTNTTVRISNEIIRGGMGERNYGAGKNSSVNADATNSSAKNATAPGEKVRVFNTASHAITTPVFVNVIDTTKIFSVKDHTGKLLPVQNALDENGNTGVVFGALVPSIGYADFEIS